MARFRADSDVLRWRGLFGICNPDHGCPLKGETETGRLTAHGCYRLWQRQHSIVTVIARNAAEEDPGAGFSSRSVLECPPQPADDDAAGPIVGGPFHLIVDVEDELRHIVVPIERNNGLRGQPAAVTDIKRCRRCC